MPEKCAQFLCKEQARVEGWCMEHRFGKCQTEGCGRQAIGRIALAKNEVVQTMSGPQVVTRYIGAPFVCQDCHDKAVGAQLKRATASAAGYLTELVQGEKVEPEKGKKAA